MISSLIWKLVVLVASAWVAREEKKILRRGVRLSAEEENEARRVGVRYPERVRVVEVSRVPWPLACIWGPLVAFRGFNPRQTIGLCLRYGIYVQAPYRDDVRLIHHELTHTAQYERLGGVRPFLARYFAEVLRGPGYPNGPLEQEASQSG